MPGKNKYGDKLIAVGTTSSIWGINSMYNGMPHFKDNGRDCWAS